MSEQLENRFYSFAFAVKNWCKQLEPDYIDKVYITQLIRSSSSVPANYIEACEPLGKRDKKNRMRIARKEAKESMHWLRMLQNADHETLRLALLNEADQIRRILSAVINKLPDD